MEEVLGSRTGGEWLSRRRRRANLRLNQLPSLPVDVVLLTV